MSTLSVQFKGAQEEILQKIVSSGLAETKSEAIRMALLKMAVDFNLYDSKMVVKTIRNDLSSDKKNISQILKDIRRVKNESIHG